MSDRHPLVVKLKSGEYDGVDIMKAWLLIESQQKQLAALQEDAKLEKRRGDMWWEEHSHKEQQLADLREALDTLSLVVGLTPIAGNKEALQEALDIAKGSTTTGREEMSATTPDQLQCEHSHWHAGGYCSYCCIDAKVVTELAVLRSQEATQQTRIAELEAELSRGLPSECIIVPLAAWNDMSTQEMRFEKRIAELEAELEEVTAELASLRDFTRTEIGKLPPEYVKSKTPTPTGRV